MRDSVLIGPGGHPMRPKPLLRATLGQILRRARREQGRTLADVARAARVSMPYLSELERGRKEASSEVLAAVCEALRIELSDLLAEAGRHLADERARRAVIEERARRRRERAGELRPESRETGRRPSTGHRRARGGTAAGHAAGRPGRRPAGRRPQPPYPVGRPRPRRRDPARPWRRPGPRRLINARRPDAQRQARGPTPSDQAQ